MDTIKLLESALKRLRTGFQYGKLPTGQTITHRDKANWEDAVIAFGEVIYIIEDCDIRNKCRIIWNSSMNANEEIIVMALEMLINELKIAVLLEGME